MAFPKVIWTDEMVAKFYELRAMEPPAPLMECARIIGVAYVTAHNKAVELGINKRSIGWGL